MPFTVEQLSICKINIIENEVEAIDDPEAGSDFDGYINRIIEEIAGNHDAKKYAIRSRDTEVVNRLFAAIYDNDFENAITNIKERLLREEISTQQQVEHLGITIHGGILILAHILESNVNRFIICKAEDSQYISDTNYELDRGYPIKRKIFKSSIFTFDEEGEISEILLSDTNRKIATYWYNDFLEVDEKRSSEANTRNAFQAIDGILNRVKSQYPADHTHLRNSTIRYFRGEESFSLEDYIQNAIGDYQPVDENLDVTNLKQRIRALPESYNFDTLFDVVRSEITARIKSQITLNSSMDLIIKRDFDENDIEAIQNPDGTKYIKIRTDKGFEHFKRRE